jgi:hypothetical protein
MLRTKFRLKAIEIQTKYPTATVADTVYIRMEIIWNVFETEIFFRIWSSL